MLCLIFLVSSSAWLAKASRDRVDAMQWQEQPEHTETVLILARGTAANVILSIGSWVVSVVLTLVTILQSDEPNFNWSFKILMIMGEFFQVCAAFYLSKTSKSARPARARTRRAIRQLLRRCPFAD